MKRFFATLLLVSVSSILIEKAALAQFKPAASSSVDGTAIQPSTVTTSSLDAGAINVGGSAKSYFRDGDLCLGTSNANGCVSGVELEFVPNSVLLGNVTAGLGVKLLGTDLLVNQGGGISAGTFKAVMTFDSATQTMMRCGASAMTTGSLAVTFSAAFTSAPVCQCTHVNTTNSNPCLISSAAAPTTSGVTFVVASGGTDVVDWCCTGAR